MTELQKTLLRTWRAHFWTHLATTAVLTMSFSLILGLLLFSKNLNRVMQLWGDEIQMTVYLKDNTTKEALQEIEKDLKSNAAVETVTFISKTEAAQSFQKSLSSYGEHFLDSLGKGEDNPFPANYQVKFKKTGSVIDQIDPVVKRTSKLTGVEDISYGQEWVTNYNILLRGIKIFTLLTVFVVCVASLFAVSNSIHASIMARREEIEILELVGATAKSIRKPFLVEGAFQGWLGSVSAIIFVGVTFSVFKGRIDSLIPSASIVDALSFYSPMAIIAFVSVGVLMGALGSYLCILRVNTGWAAAENRT